VNFITIGIFDSGIGGLTVFRRIIDVLPSVDVIYFGDTARMPYGCKSRETIIGYAEESIQFLKSKGADIIVAACGTVSTLILDQNCEYNGKPIGETKVFGVVGPSCKAVVQKSKNGRIGVIATSAAISSGMYEVIIKKFLPKAKVFSAACPILAPLIENSNGQRFLLRRVLEDYICPLAEKQIDTLILGCTHYPIVKNLIRKIIPNTFLIDSGKETAAELGKCFGSNKHGEGKHEFYVSDMPENFAQNATMFLGKNISKEVHKVKI
jgi:glutamate racemase